MKNQQQLERTVDGAFKSSVSLPDYTAGYLTKLYVVTVIALLPALAYLVLALSGLYFYFASAIHFLPGLYGDANLFYIVLYVAVLLLASSILIFLLRPFVSSKRQDDGLALHQEQEPSIYYLANTLAKKIGIDRVDRILISTEVIVDVYYQTPRDLYDKKLTLKIGLPLLSTLSSNELCALIAREYGHYAESRVKYSYLIIRFLRSWFYRVVHNEDGWSDKVDAFAENYSWLRILTMPVYVGISVVNSLFQMFLNLTDTITSQVVHETEHYADHFEAQIIGGDNFDRLLKHLVQIDQAYHSAVERLLSGEISPGNISDLIFALYEKNPLQSDQFIEMARSDHFNSWHLLPTPSSRTRKILKSNIASIFSLERSIDMFFSDIDALGIKVSELFYQEHNLTADENITASVIDERERPIAMKKEEVILQRFASGLYRRDIVWEFPEADKFSQLNEAKIIPFLNKVVISIRRSLPEFNKYVDYLDEYLKIKVQYHFYQWLVKDGSKNRPDAETIDELKFSVKDFDEKYQGKKEAYRKSYGVRVLAAVELGRTSKAYASAKRLIAMLTKLGRIQDHVNDAKVKCSTLEKLIVRRAEGDGFHQKTISRLTKMILKIVDEMEKTMAKYPTNLISEKPEMDIMAHRVRLEELNGADYERMVADRFRELVRFYEAFNTAISAKLAQFVEMVERKQDIESVVTVSLKDGEHAA